MTSTPAPGRARSDPGPEAGSVGIVGIGNVLMQDDGFGPCVVARLADDYDLPDGVRLIDAGTPGPELAYRLIDLASLVVVDAVRVDGPPGELCRFVGEEILESGGGSRPLPHDPHLGDALRLARLQGDLPEPVVLLGAIPKRVAAGTELTPELEDAVPRAVDAVLSELESLGIEVRRRRGAEAGAAWWRRARSR